MLSRHVSAGVFLLLSVSAFSAVTLTEPEVPHGVPATPWDLALGHHRAIVHVEQAAPAVRVHLPWRVQMQGMQNHQVIVVDAATDKRVQNVVRFAADRMSGDIGFQPATVPGDYHVYYLPLRPYHGLNDPADYTGYQCQADPAWLQQTNQWQRWPAAQVRMFQARTEFDRFDPMEIIASESETKDLLAGHPEPFLLFAEDRRHPIRMQRDLPLRWVQSGPRAEFAGEAQRNEYYCFQIGVFPPKQALSNVTVTPSDFRSAKDGMIPSSAITCFNTGGVDTWGKPFTKTVNVPAGAIQPLWVGVDVAHGQPPGEYQGTLTVRAEGLPPQSVAVRLKVLPETIAERGDNETWRHSRLRWLNSTAGIADNLVPPYTPLVVTGRKIQCLGREVELGENGLPARIRAGATDLLAAPVRFAAAAPGTLRFTRQGPAAVEWEAGSLRGRMEYDGHLSFTIATTGEGALEIPFRTESAQYMMGAGHGGGLRPKEWQWKWSGPYDSFWLGSPDVGLHCELRGGSYHGPMLNLYHPAPPPSWGKGGVTITETNGVVTARATGSGEKFEFALLITPVKPLDMATHLRTRYYHGNTCWTFDGADPTPPPELLTTGVNVMNVHHASIYNPYINYPFLKTAELSGLTSRMHRQNVKVKLYNTVRELSNMVTELWALRSLGNEVIAGGGGGGYAWCREHMITGYSPAWFQRFSPDAPPDAAFVTSGESRWYNYYIEGIGWVVRHADIDGLYLDDVTYDRHILQRVRWIMSQSKKGCLIDLHSNTGFSIGPANQYAEFMPYIDRTWFGESFNYNAMTPDQWLVQVSGIPWGVPGEMLQGGGNPWRGPLYGMTVRQDWETGGVHCDARPVWRVWDRFGIADATMIGYWDPACPVRTDNPDVLATVYRKPGQSLIALASWAPTPAEVRLTVDWKALGLDPARTKLFAPRSGGFQPFAQWKPSDPIPVQPRRGWMIIASETGPVPADSAARDDTLKGRSIRLAENFAKPLSPEWTVHASPNPGTSVTAGNGALTLAAAANVSACIEREVPQSLTAVDCRIASLPSGGETWGPGLALLWPDGKGLRVYARVPDGSFAVDLPGGDQRLRLGHLAGGGAVTLRLRLDEKHVLAEAMNEDEDWQTLATFPREQFPGSPTRVRIGKMQGVDGIGDHTTPGATSTTRISLVRFYGR